MSYIKETVTPEVTTISSADYADFLRTMVHDTAGAVAATAMTTTGTGTVWLGGPTSSGMTTRTLLPSIPPAVSWSGPKPPTILQAKSRMNKDTITRLGPVYSFDKVRKKLVNELLRQLISSNAVNVSSTVNEKTGAVTFTATVSLNE